MSIATADDVAFVRFRAPDPARMRAFLLDFGMLPAQEDGEGGAVFMRGYGEAPFVHATCRGDAGFAGFGIRVGARADLEALAAHDGVAIEALDAPGGGEVVRLTDPDGFIVEAVFGQAPALTRSTAEPLAWNEKSGARRIAAFRRIDPGPSHVLRLGHVVLGVRDFRRSEAWYKTRFGLITSDEIQPEPGVGIGAFLRADRGEERTSDHHTLFLFEHPAAPCFVHSAFEVVDLDDLMAGRDHLAIAGHTPMWGVGRHLLGSQIFDYWTDPWGHEIEHWTDGDQLRASDGGGTATPAQLMGVQWGMPFPGPMANNAAPPPETERVG